MAIGLTAKLIERATQRPYIKRPGLDPYSRAILHKTFVQDGTMSELEFRGKLEGQWHMAGGDAATDLAQAYYRDGNHQRARQLLTQAVLDGDAFASSLLGQMWEQGKGGEQSHEVACHLYARAAEQGHAFAAWRLGLAYGTGLGIAQSIPTGYFWLIVAAASSSAPAEAAGHRDTFMAYMTPEQITRAQRAALCWRPTPPAPIRH